MEFGILGPLAVWEDGRELQLGGAKPRAVLAVLILHANEVVPRARLVDDLWGERPPSTAVKAVQVYVSQLRKALGEGVIETQLTGYRLRLAPAALDLHRFEQMLEHGRQLLADGAARESCDQLRRALALWRGPALAGLEYEAFARNEIGRLEQLRLTALEHRLEADLALGRDAEAVGELEGLVRDHPLRETLRGLLMLALYRAGRQADALAVYQDARTALVDELGLDPSQSLQRLEKAILQQDPSLDRLEAAPFLPRPAAAGRPDPDAKPVACAACGADNPRDARYCLSCGASLAADLSIASRKVVTVLFCDVVPSSELGEQLDPESLRVAMSQYFERATVVLERYGGTIEKFSGDAIMAVFGVPAVREDDALRAVRAAAVLRESVATLESELAYGAGLGLRIGINTGEVVVGNPAAGQGFITGIAMGLGKRLEEAAAPGEILLGQETHLLVSHAVDATRLEPLKPKGAGREVTAFRLESVDAEATAIRRRDDALLVGRERELEQLRGLYADVADGGGARLVSILGDPGIGKSRLAREFLTGLAETATVLIGRCPPYGEGVTFWPLRELLQQAGRDEGELAGNSHEVFAAVRHILEDLARERPLVVVFDDVQWAEPTFLDFVEYLAARLGNEPVLVLCLARPDLAEQRPAWLQAPAVTLFLEPLSEADAQVLLEVLAVPQAVRARIAETAEGNPLFVEQLAAIADEHSVPGQMPGSIRGVLHERLDRLGREERSVLERAAVAGRSFTFEAVFDLTPPDDRERVQGSLSALVRKMLVRPDTTMPEEGFRFHHALIRDAAYEGIPKGARADLHERVAARLETEAADDALVGYHLEQAFGLRRELGTVDADLAARAGRLLRTAGQEAFRHSDLPATVSLFERACVLLPGDEVAQLLPALGEALFEAGRFTEAGEALAEAIAWAEDDPVLEARARVEQQFVRLQTGGAIGEAPQVAADALRVFEGHGHDLGQCRAGRLQAWMEWAEGRSAAADEAWRRAAAHARAAGEERELFEILGWRASAAAWGATAVEEAIQTCMEIREEVRSSRVAVAVTLHPLAVLRAMQGEFGEARSLIAEGNAILADVGRMQSAVSHHEAAAKMLAGDHAEAEEKLQAGYERLDQMGEKTLLATTAALLARTTYAQERYAEAEAFCSVSERTAADEDVWTQVMWRGVCGKILARQGRIDEAEALAHEAVRLVARTDLLQHHGDALVDLAEVLRLGGRLADADAAARQALELFTEKGNVVSAGQARSLVAAIASTRPQTTIGGHQ